MIRLDQLFFAVVRFEFFPPVHGNVCVCQRVRGVPLSMSKIHSACPDSDRSDGLVTADVLLRQEPEEDEEEEDEEEDDREEEDDDDGTDEGYSE